MPKQKHNPVFICKNCGKRVISTHDAYRKPRYCSRECHRASIQKEIRCLECGKIFIVGKTQERKFCSQTCSNRYNQPRNPDKRAIFICKGCNREFEGWIYRQPVFCSKLCMSKYAASQPKLKARKPESLITINCEYCKENYIVHKCQRELRNSKFCSVACRANYQSIHKRGKNNPNWTGGHINDYGPNWNRQKRKARKRDLYTCQVCGYKRSDGNRFLDVHHIVPVKKFDDLELANNLNNLITLCRKCHPKVEKGKIPCPIPKSLEVAS